MQDIKNNFVLTDESKFGIQVWDKRNVDEYVYIKGSQTKATEKYDSCFFLPMK